MPLNLETEYLGPFEDKKKLQIINNEMIKRLMSAYPHVKVNRNIFEETVPVKRLSPKRRISFEELMAMESNILKSKARIMVDSICEKHEVPFRIIMGCCRMHKTLAARHEAIIAVRYLTGWSLTRLGRFFNKDHTTILHVLRKHERLTKS